VAVLCPYCRFEMELKGARPGRFRPSCQQCGKAFVLIVPEQYGEPAKAIKIEEAPSSEADAQRARQRAAVKRESQQQARQAAAQATMAAEAASAAGVTMAAGTVGPTGPAGAATIVQGRPAERLGGYEIIRELGRGAMGSVYLARQVSLDRPVAVKVMNPEWASDPIFVSRFTREAYAAAQLVHHNVVQIYDIGEERGRNFFSMEFVDGQTLGALVARHGRLNVREAVGFVLQAARGLKFAHDKQMIHRDVKPDNLMLNREGIVKVADLGLVKTPESMRDDRAGGGPAAAPAGVRGRTGINITQANKAMGTPAFMAPEQVLDAAHVDQRADIYSLGCSLYALVTGRTVHEGATADEIMTKQATQPIAPPEAVVKDVPHELSDVLMKMLEKDPAKRYQKLDDVIRDLERFLGLAGPGADPSFDGSRPTESDGAELAAVAAAFGGVRTAMLRPWLIAGFAALIVLLSAGLLATGRIAAGLAAIGVGALAPALYVLVSGIFGGTHVFRRLRQYAIGSSFGTGIKAGSGLLLAMVLLYVLGLHWVALGSLIVAIGLAAGMHFAIDRALTGERAEPVERARKLLRNLRLRGLEEDSIRRFICQYAGERWEALYEALFGYEAKIAARQQWGVGEDGRFRRRHAAWRDRVIRWIDAHEQGRKLEKDRNFLAQIERKALEAKGVNELTARRQAAREADQIVATARETRRKMPGYVDVPVRTIRTSPVTLLLGSRARFVAGVLLIAACVLWMHQNGLIPGKAMKDIGQQMIDEGRVADAGEVKMTLAEAFRLEGKEIRPLALPGLSEDITTWLSGYQAGLAGLVLVFSGMFAGVRMTVFLLPAVGVILFGEALGVPGVWRMSSAEVSMAAGGVLALLGFSFGRS